MLTNSSIAIIASGSPIHPIIPTEVSLTDVHLSFNDYTRAFITWLEIPFIFKLPVED